MEAYEYEDQDVVVVYDDSRPLTFDMQRTEVTQSGALSVDTLLDRVVFDVPITSYDMWQKCHLLERSRRRNGECGVDTKRHLAEEARFSDSDSDSELRGRRAECR